MTAILALTFPQIAALAAIAFAAGVVRGFTGFALSAFAMAIGVLILAPIELIPVLFWLEMGASLLMGRAGWRDADRRVAIMLIGGSAVGTFFGVWMTVMLDPATSRIIALSVLIALAALQLGKVRLNFLATTTGTIATGVLAGVVTGLAGVGGMVVALYVLSRDSEPKVMRATLVVFLFGVMGTSLATHLYWGTMTETAAYRGLILVPICLLGVWLGAKFFTPRWQPYYRPVCLWLLIGLGTLSLLRTVI